MRKSEVNRNNFDTIIFADRKIKNVNIPKSIKYINSNAFFYCKNLTNVDFPNDSELKIIRSGAFSNTNIQKITIPKNVCKIEQHCFQYCNELNEVKFEEGSKLGEIDKNMFYSCKKLKIISIPENSSIKKISKDAFNKCLIENLYIPSNLVELEEE